MLTNVQYLQSSLDLHLFFARIMKEHAFFLQTSFTAKDLKLYHRADMLRIEFDKLLAETISLSDGNVSLSVLESGEVITPYTMKAEMVSEYYTGVHIPTGLTEAETRLKGDIGRPDNPMLMMRVTEVNQKALNLLKSLIEFKTMVLSDVLSCRMFTNNYPLLLDHIIREARMYYQMIQKLQNREELIDNKKIFEEESFWNNIMGEHSEFIRGLLDPSEKELIASADDFAKKYEELEKEAKEAVSSVMPSRQLTAETLEETVKLRDFKTAGTAGILDCKIKSIIIPLLGDHVIREASHYIRMLRMFSGQ